MSFTVAIDGPAAAGKGTIAKALARHFGLAHLDTGLLYRAVGAKVRDGLDPVVAARSLTPDDLDAPDLRTQAVADHASRVAVIAEVRAALVDFQREFAGRAGGAVLDGRDIGTVICPLADVKLFITASAECRATRRHKELADRGNVQSYESVLAAVLARDKRDRERATAPLVPASDALELDTSDLAIEEAVNRAIDIVASRRSGK